MPEEYQKSFKNLEYPDDLFSWAALQQIEAEYDEEGDEWGGREKREDEEE